MAYQNYSDFTAISGILQQNDFGYIVPVDIYLSEYYNNPYRGNIRTYYLQYLWEQLPYDSNNIILATDKHASLYEDMDAFLTDMSSKILSLKQHVLHSVNLRNFIMVDNNLKDCDWANLIAASLLAISDIPDYPKVSEGLTISDPVFTIAPIDVVDEQVYFAKHTDNTITIENLLNFDVKGVTKPVVVDKILRYMMRTFDFQEFLGKPYSEVRRVKIQRKLQDYLEEWKDYILVDYKIDSVSAEYDPKIPGTVRIICRYRIQPKNTIEWYRGEIIL